MSTVEPRPGHGMTRGVWIFTGSVVGAALLLVAVFWNYEPESEDKSLMRPGVGRINPSVFDDPTGDAPSATGGRQLYPPPAAPDDTPASPELAETSSETTDSEPNPEHGAIRAAVGDWTAPDHCVRQIGEGPEGKVMLTFTIEPGGELSSTISWRIDGTREEQFASCLEERTPDIAFPAFDERVVATASFEY